MSHQYTIGVIGGGQLARMMYQAGIPLGFGFRLLSEAADSSAAQVVPDVVVGDYTDQETLFSFARSCDVITFDHEHVPTALLRRLVDLGQMVQPGPEALTHAQDKVEMRQRLSGIGVACPAYRVCTTPEDVLAFADRHGWPVIAKTSRGGYDGKGVFELNGPTDAHRPFQDKPRISAGELVRIMVEEYIDFGRELSVIVARSVTGESVAYPVSETIQHNGVCTETLTPAPGLDPTEVFAIEQMAHRIAGELGVAGVLAVELMQARDGRILVNELAMRPHNTGHWTIDGALTSQFENHLRAVAGVPLGDTRMHSEAVAMVNVLGGATTDLSAAMRQCFLGDKSLRVHLYGKPVTARRKVGHVTALASTAADAMSRARAGAAILMGGTHV